MNKIQEQVTEFHKFYSVPIGEYPQLIPEDRQNLRLKLIEEELAELKTAYTNGDIVEIADAIGDLLYVVFGTAVEHGIDIQPIMDEIQRSNLSKLGFDGKPIYAENGKVLKGSNYSPPNLVFVLRKAHQRLF